MILINNFRKINEVKGNDMVVKRNPPKQSKRGSMLRKQLFDMILPGQDFMPRIHGGNRPAESGLYLAFYEYQPPLATSGIKRHAGSTMADYDIDDKSWQICRSAGAQLANYFDGKWGMNHRVLAWMGPLPILNIKSLLECTPGYTKNQTFYIATLKEAANLKYEHGPYGEFLLAFLKIPEPNHFIFVYDSDLFNGIPTPLSKSSKNNPSGWKTLSEKQQKKYMKMMKDSQK